MLAKQHVLKQNVNITNIDIDVKLVVERQFVFTRNLEVGAKLAKQLKMIKKYKLKTLKFKFKLCLKKIYWLFLRLFPIL